MLPKSRGPADRFVLETRIGGGGMGDIFKGLDRQTGQTVAIKLLRQGANPHEQGRFGREIAILADLRHPNIVQYVAHGEWAEGELFLAMEWLDGEDLSRRQRRQPLGMKDSVEVVRRSAAAMAAIHARGVVHRDLKLANIFLVRGRGTAVKLIDFGVVKSSTPDEFPTERGAIIGTPHYMAPEQARGGHIDARADVYSLGAVLFRLLIGRNVFETDQVIALLGRLVLEDPPTPSSLRFDIPEALDEVLLRALSRDPAQRYDNGGDFARALARVGQLNNNDPPATDRSASAIRKADPNKSDTITGSDITSSSMTGASLPPSSGGRRRAVAERRVVAAVVYDLGGVPLSPETEGVLRAALGADTRVEVLLGEKMIAVLGVEQSTGDEVVRAARAALSVVRTTPGARAVVAVGHAIRGRKNLAGEALERAARQIEATAPGTARVDRSAARALEGRFVIQDDDRGGLLVREDESGFGSRMLLGRATSTVGREKEIALLIGIYNELIEEGTPRAAIVVGPAGVGKSRVCGEAARRLETAALAPEVLVCRGDTMTQGSSISALGRSLRGLMDIRDGQPIEAQMHNVKEHLSSRLPRALRFLAAFLGELVGVPFPDEGDEPLRAARANAQLMQSRLRSALEAYVRARAEKTPQLLVIEDVHHADETTLDLCDWLLGCADLRFGLLAFGRPEIHTRIPTLWDKRTVTRLTLPPLSPIAADRLVASALPQLPPQQRTDLVKRAGGNALFLEELIRSTHEGNGELPLSVQVLVQTRLDHLESGVREVVRAASVFGQTAWHDGVSALLEREVAEDLATLVKKEIITRHPRSRIQGQNEYSFRQALVRDAAYESILEEDREALHLAAGDWLESVGDVDIGLVARHVDAGGDFERATMLYARATRQAYTMGAHLETALELAERGLSCGASGGVRSQLLLAKALTCLPLGDLVSAVAAADEAAGLAPAGSDMWAESQRLAAAARIEMGQSAEGDARAEAALASVGASELSGGMRAQLLAVRVRGLVDQGKTTLALEIAERAVAVAHEAGESSAIVRAYDAQLFALMHAAELSSIIESGEALVALADHSGDGVLATRARLNTASGLNVLGAFEAARALCERALADARSRRMRILEAFALHNGGMSDARLGNLDLGIEKQRQAQQIADETGVARLRIQARIYETLFLVWRGGPGDLGAAQKLADSADAESSPGLRMATKFALARVSLARRDFANALTHAKIAYEHLAAGPVEEWEEGTRLAYIEALHGSGQRAASSKVLAEAFERLVARVASITNSGHRESFLNRNEEIRRLVHLAEERLGKSLP